MDGTCNVTTIVGELECSLRSETTWAGVRTVVRAWAAKHWLLPCTTTPDATGLRIAYCDEEKECHQTHIDIPSALLECLRAEYEAGNGNW
jgi:hypothetical protein